MPGLPVNTRWWLVSIVGRPRSARSCCTRSRLVSRRTSALTCSSPISASSSASSSSIGRLGGSSRCRRRPRRRRRGRRRRRARRRRPRRLAGARHAGGVHRRQQHRRGSRSMAAISSGDGTRSIGGRGVGEPEGHVVVAVARPLAVAGVGLAAAGRTACSGVSSHRRRPSISPDSRSCVDGVTNTGGSSCGPMSSSHASSSVVGQPPVAVDHGGHESPASIDHVGAVITSGRQFLAARRSTSSMNAVDVPRQHPTHRT